MRVHIVSALAVYDCNGECLKDGYVVGVYYSLEGAKEKLRELDEMWQGKYDYYIEEFEVK